MRNSIAIQKSQSALNGHPLGQNPEMALLGGLTRATNQTRVMTANIQGSFSRPADLDAFLRGSIGTC